jgi:hypothetical protein
MTSKIYHPEEKHPQPYQQDLNPDANVGQNRSEIPQEGKDTDLNARDLKDLHRMLDGYNDDELARIPILREGSRLEQGATYIDLRAREPREFTATANMEATSENWYVPKSRVDYPLWNRLIGVTNPDRLDEARVEE